MVEMKRALAGAWGGGKAHAWTFSATSGAQHITRRSTITAESISQAVVAHLTGDDDVGVLKLNHRHLVLWRAWIEAKGEQQCTVVPLVSF